MLWNFSWLKLSHSNCLQAHPCWGCPSHRRDWAKENREGWGHVWTPMKGSCHPQGTAASLQCHTLPPVHQGSQGAQTQCCLLWDDTKETRAAHLLWDPQRGAQASCPERKTTDVIMRDAFHTSKRPFSSAHLEPGWDSTLNPVQNMKNPPSVSETAWVSAWAAELGWGGPGSSSSTGTLQCPCCALHLT